MTPLRISALTLALFAVACAPVSVEEEVIIVEPAIEAPAHNEFDKGAEDCLKEEITGDGIGGTGCPAID